MSFFGREKEIPEFNATREAGKFIKFDDLNGKFAVPVMSFTGKVTDREVYDYAQINSFELVEDGVVLAKGGIGRPLIEGGNMQRRRATCAKLQLKITLKDKADPAVAKFIIAHTRKSGFFYKTNLALAERAMKFLDEICNPNGEYVIEENASVADEIMKLKRLLDDGTITEEEFAAGKKKILS